MTSPNNLTLRHICILSASILSAGAFGFAALSFAETADFAIKPTEANYLINRRQFPLPSREMCWLLMGGCLVGVGAIATGRDNQGQPLIDFQADRLAEDLADTANICSGVVGGAIATVTAKGLDFALIAGKKTAKTIYLHTAPQKLKDALEELEAERTWFDKFLSAPHNRLAGKTRSGKTILTFKLLIDYLIKHEGHCDLLIADINYGKPDEDGRLNDWLGIPSAYIRTEFEEIERAISQEVEELNRRRRICKEAAQSGKKLTEKLSPRLILIDEFDSTSEELKDGDFLKHIRALLKQGAGYGIKAIVIGQSLAVGESGISLATGEQMGIALLGENTTKSNEVGYFKADTQSLIEKAKKIKKANKRPIVVQLGEGEPRVQIVPSLSGIHNVRIAIPEETDPDLYWWKSIFTSEKKAWLEDLATRYIQGEIKSPLKSEVCKGFGVQFGSRGGSRYTEYIKPAWERAVKKAEENC